MHDFDFLNFTTHTFHQESICNTYCSTCIKIYSRNLYKIGEKLFLISCSDYSMLIRFKPSPFQISIQVLRQYKIGASIQALSSLNSAAQIQLMVKNKYHFPKYTGYLDF